MAKKKKANEPLDAWLSEELEGEIMPIPLETIAPPPTPRKVEPAFIIPLEGSAPSVVPAGRKKCIVADADTIFDLKEDTDLSPDQKLFIIAYMQTGTITHACRKLKLDRRLIDRWLNENGKFADLINQCLEVVADELEQKALIEALGGNDRLLITMLKATRPDKYAERRQVSGKDGGPVQVASWTDMLKSVQGVTVDVDADTKRDSQDDEKGSKGSSVVL